MEARRRESNFSKMDVSLSYAAASVRSQSHKRCPRAQNGAVRGGWSGYTAARALAYLQSVYPLCRLPIDKAF